MTESLYEAVRRILWEEWDPIGVRDLGGPDDEYDTYAGGLTRCLLEGRDEFAIVQFLEIAETHSMGLSASTSEHRTNVARRLIALRSPHTC